MKNFEKLEEMKKRELTKSEIREAYFEAKKEAEKSKDKQIQKTK